MRSRNTRAEPGFPRRSVAAPKRWLPAARGRARAAGAVLACAAVALLACAAAPPAAAGLGSASGPPAGAEADTCCEETERHRGYPVVAASALAGEHLRKVRVRGDVLRARTAGGELELVAGSPFYRLGDEIGQVANPAYVHEGRLWMPVELARRLAGRRGRGAAGTDAGSGDDGEPVADAGGGGPWTVVVDPGHGGRDPGAHGPGGTLEKHVVLEIARRLERRLEEREGIDVVLTRTGDEFVPLAERSRFAVRHGADLFVSLHANAARNRRARGFETYFLGEARTERAREVAMRENASVRYEEGGGGQVPDDLQVILANLDLRGYQRESSYVAGMMQNALRSQLSVPDRGVKQNIFLVLVNASGSMPAVLVETGFISHPGTERRLASEQGQAEIASGLADAVSRYFRDRERRESVQTAARR